MIQLSNNEGLAFVGLIFFVGFAIGVALAALKN